MSEFAVNCLAIQEKILSEQWYLSCQRCWRSDLWFEHHHIFYRSEFPKHERLHCIENIYFICTKCHKELHSNKSLRDDIVKERWLDLIFIK